MAEAMKIHLKKNAAANGLVLMERLQGLTATDVTHGRHGRGAFSLQPFQLNGIYRSILQKA